MTFANFDFAIKKRFKSSKSLFLPDKDLEFALNRISKKFGDLDTQYQDFLDANRPSSPVFWKDDKILH